LSYSFFITVSKGLEELLRTELSEILVNRGVVFNDPKADRGGVGFKGEVEDALRVCLHSRVATRVYLKLHEFAAPTPERLYAGVKSIRWRDHFTANETIAIDFVTRESQIAHTQFGAQKSKDAIVDQFKSTTGERPSVDLQNPDIQIQIYLNRDVATVNLDLSGRSLHERGYRKGFVDAPLKENLGAAILMLSGWKEVYEKGGVLLDPMCGSGTFAIEAAWMAKNRAPGILRERWGFQRWKPFVPEIWKKLRDEAKSAERPCPVKIFASDQSARAYSQCILNAEAAGVAKEVFFERREMTLWTVKPAETGLFIVNPPYGERLGDEEGLISVYRSIGDTLKKAFPGWKGGVFTGNALLAKEVGLKPSRRIPLWNGSIECRLQTYELFLGSRLPPKTPN
jgi:23S rRNA (guanine2445-N2)-methyltransferase / 23S rRNA (guanine2069-N7)-methyltransferase